MMRMSTFSFQTIATHAATALMIGLISAVMVGASMAWLNQGASIWVELRFAELANCFGF